MKRNLCVVGCILLVLILFGSVVFGQFWSRELTENSEVNIPITGTSGVEEWRSVIECSISYAPGDIPHAALVSNTSILHIVELDSGDYDIMTNTVDSFGSETLTFHVQDIISNPTGTSKFEFTYPY